MHNLHALSPTVRPVIFSRRACWRTDASDHGGDAISAMAYSPSFQGLPGGDGHAGWLVSASRGLLNLWECSASGGRGEASLTARPVKKPSFMFCYLLSGL